ncbi:DUF6418 domain-containing protein [Pseudomonas sp. CAU 1711]|uniref:DUF6418 domain-containing protein n=1 Tax=Pseudomonas sp. CAU 1711 TaxID=3140356 RepID=UPI00325FE7B8
MFGVIYGGGGALLFFLLGVVVWRKFSSIFTLLFPFIYGYFGVFVSCLYLELFPSFIFEQGVLSFFNGSSLLLIAVLFVSVVSVIFVFQALANVVRVPEVGRPLLSVKVLILVIALELLLIIHVFLSGSPLVEVGITKFNFWREKAILESLSIFNWALYPILFVVGANGAYFMYVRSRVSWVLSFSVLILACLYYVSWGNKFSALLLVVFFYFVPGVVSFRRRYGMAYPVFRRTVLLGLVFAFTVASLVLLQYERFQSRGLDAGEQLIERVLVLQGHVWWGSVNEVLSIGPDYDQIAKEFGAILSSESEGPVGMRYIMESLAPEYLYLSYLESGVEFTAGYPAILLLVFSFWGVLLFSVFWWGFYGLFLFYLARLIFLGSRVRLFFSAYLYMASLAWFQHGSLSGFVNWKFFVVCLFLFFLEAVLSLRGLKEVSVSQGGCDA